MLCLAASNEHTNCLLCNTENPTALKDYPKVGLVKCDSCKFVFTRKIPSKEELIEYYTNSYERTSYLSPITVKRYHELLDRFEPYRKTGRLLDVGAGYGFFLEIARERGWEIFGTELTDEAVNHCREKGITMFKGEFQDIPLEPESFDIIISIEVLEHINNPIEYVEKAHEVLRKGGMFYLTTPNFNAYLRYRLKEQYNMIEYPNHLCYYTAKTLRKLFNEHGFRTQRVATTGISLTRLRTSKGKSNQEYVSETSDDEMVRYRIEKNSFLRIGKRITNSILNLLKIGDSLKGSFIKE